MLSNACTLSLNIYCHSEDQREEDVLLSGAKNLDNINKVLTQES